MAVAGTDPLVPRLVPGLGRPVDHPLKVLSGQRGPGAAALAQGDQQGIGGDPALVVRLQLVPPQGARPSARAIVLTMASEGSRPVATFL